MHQFFFYGRISFEKVEKNFTNKESHLNIPRMVPFPSSLCDPGAPLDKSTVNLEASVKPGSSPPPPPSCPARPSSIHPPVADIIPAFVIESYTCIVISRGGNPPTPIPCCAFSQPAARLLTHTHTHGFFIFKLDVLRPPRTTEYCQLKVL